MKKLTRNAIIGASSLSVCDAFSQSKKSSFAFRVAYSDDDESSSTTPEDVKESPCQYYNSIEQRISWALRRQRCNTERGCKFIGRSISGTCLPSTDTQNADIDGSQQATANENITSTTTQISANNTQTQQRNDTNQNPIDTRSPTNNLSATKHRMYAEIVNDDQEFRIPPLRVLVHETLSSSAVDSIRDSQELANELAKCLVIEVLDRKENRGKLGELLQDMFVSDTVLSPTRELIYWSLTLDNTIKNTIFYTNLHRNYWMGLSNVGQHVRTTRGMTREQGAKDFTQDALVALAIKWLHDPVNRKSVINPLLDWTLKSQESVISPLAIISAEAIPWAKVRTSCSCFLFSV